MVVRFSLRQNDKNARQLLVSRKTGNSGTGPHIAGIVNRDL